jgi:hypothetical protein
VLMKKKDVLVSIYLASIQKSILLQISYEK